MSQPNPDSEGLLPSLLKSAGIGQQRQLTSDNALECWGLDPYPETATDLVARTLNLRKIGTLVGAVSYTHLTLPTILRV